MNSTVVPAVLQLRALVWQTNAWNDATDEPYYNFVPIIAWRISDEDYVEPILIDKPVRNESWVIEYPDGQLCDQGSTIYADFKAFIAQLRRHHRAQAVK